MSSFAVVGFVIYLRDILEVRKRINCTENPPIWFVENTYHKSIVAMIILTFINYYTVLEIHL